MAYNEAAARPRWRPRPTPGERSETRRRAGGAASAGTLKVAAPDPRVAALRSAARRLRCALGRTRGVTEKKMFGGVCLLLRGNMLCAVSRRGFMFRVGKEQEPEALARPGAKPVVMRGRRIGGYVRVDPARCRGRALAAWVALAKKFVFMLPPKP